MANKWLLMAAVIGVALGCKSVRSVRLDPMPRPSETVQDVEPNREAGRKLAAEQPRTLERMQQAAQALEAAARALPADYEAQWQAAEAFAFVSEHGPDEAARTQAAKTGIALARRAQELQPNRVEGHYWYALNVGLLADVDRSYGLQAVSEMETALKRAGALDERYDYAGPLRVLGILHLRTPAPPLSIGSTRKALRLLQRATELFPDYPENHLYLAEAWRESKQPASARVSLQKVLAAPAWPERQFESNEWKAAANKILSSLPGQ